MRLHRRERPHRRLLTCAAILALGVFASAQSPDFSRESVEAPPDAIKVTIKNVVDERPKPYVQNSAKENNQKAFSKSSVQAGAAQPERDNVYKTYTNSHFGVSSLATAKKPHVGSNSHMGHTQTVYGSKPLLINPYVYNPFGVWNQFQAYNPYGIFHYRNTREIADDKKEFFGAAVKDFVREKQPYKIVCYYGNWAHYRKAPMTFDPENVDPNACTHLMYSFAGLKDGVIVSLEEELDIKNGSYAKAIALKEKNPDLKVMIAIGGWNEGAKTYSEMASTAQKQKVFIDSVLDFIGEHKFDGLDLDWEYPGASERGGSYADKANFAKLVDELSKEFQPRNLLLSAAVSASPYFIKGAYDIPRISKKLDFINVMTYDLHGSWESKVDHHAPLMERTHDDWNTKALNVEAAMKYWASQGAPKHKLIVGVPFYGRSWTLRNPSQNGPGAGATGAGEKGEFTDEAGFVAYNEICSMLKEGGWQEGKDSDGNVYITKGDQWIGYDTVEAIRRKMKFVKENKYGGGMIWAIDLDDFANTCGGGEWPLLTVMNQELDDENVELEDLGGYPGDETGDNDISVIEGNEVDQGTGSDDSDVQAECDFSGYQGNPSDCGSFFQCANGKKMKTLCQPGLHWNSNTNTCDWPAAAQCSPSAYEGQECTGDSELKPNPEDCGSYVQCVSGKLFKFPCPAGLHFNTEIKSCDFPANANCGSSSGGSSDSSSSSSGSQGSAVVVIDEEELDNQGNPEYEDSSEEVEEKPQRPSVPEAPSTTTDNQYKVVCYFTNWAWYRPGTGKYTPDEIDPELCTHIVYGFAVLRADTHTLKAHDRWADFDNDFYKRVTALKGKNRKVLLALGGWNDSAGSKYSNMVSKKSNRKKFIDHAVKFLLDNNFDGLDLDWEYPRCWQVDCTKGPESDKENFALWVEELRAAFEPHNLMLTAAVSPAKKVIDAGYDVPRVAAAMDYISVMTYDYHGQWDKKTGHVAPMFDHPDNADPVFNVNFTVNYWLEKGLPKNKLIVGMPMYGKSFTILDRENTGLASPSRGSGANAGEFTRAKGFLAYYEICHFVKSMGWTVVRDPEARMGPYAFKGDQWVGYDDVDTIRFKTNYIVANDLGGAMIWALDLDDFNNRCNCESHPLLKTINRYLGRLQTPDPGCQMMGKTRIAASEDDSTNMIEHPAAPYSDCEGAQNYQPHPSDCNKYKVCNNGEFIEKSCPSGLHWNKAGHCDWPTSAGCDANAQDPDVSDNEVESPPPAKPQPAPVKPATPAPAPVGPAGTSDDSSGMKVVCYFTNWAWYRPGVGKYVPGDIDPELCTHINYGFAVLDPNNLVIKTHDSWADIDNEFYTKVSDLKKSGKVKVLVALGGWNDSLGNKYSKMVSSAASRKRFIDNAVEFIRKWGFQGLDLDWEYPKCWQVNCDAGPDADKENFAALVRELRAAFDAEGEGWLLSAATSPSKKVIDAGYDVPSLSRDLDIINVMTYDYHGHWDKKTGHVAPLFDYEEADNAVFNAEYTMNYYKELGADPKKLVMGMPMYGQAFTLSDASNTGLNSKGTKGQAGPQTRAAGFLAYYEICTFIRQNNWNVVYHPEDAMGPYAYKGNQWVGFDDVAQIRRKSQWVKDNGFGGGMIWALDLDDFKNVCGCENYPLLRTINRVLRDYSLPDPQCAKLGYAANEISAYPYSTGQQIDDSDITVIEAKPDGLKTPATSLGLAPNILTSLASYNVNPYSELSFHQEVNSLPSYYTPGFSPLASSAGQQRYRNIEG